MAKSNKKTKAKTSKKLKKEKKNKDMLTQKAVETVAQKVDNNNM